MSALLGQVAIPVGAVQVAPGHLVQATSSDTHQNRRWITRSSMTLLVHWTLE
jgi:hypothetical protein